MQITGLKFKTGTMWNPENLADMKNVSDKIFVLDTVFAKTTYKFSNDWKSCTITNVNKSSNHEMKPLVVNVDFVEVE